RGGGGRGRGGAGARRRAARRPAGGRDHGPPHRPGPAGPRADRGPVVSGGAFADQLATLVPAGGDADGGNPGGAPAGGAAGADTAAGGAPCRYRATLAEHWNCPLVPQGGVVAAVAAEAMRRELDAPDQPIRSLTTLFVTPVPAGPV